MFSLSEESFLTKSANSLSRLFLISIILTTVVTGFLTRTASIALWDIFPAQYTYNNGPLLSNLDGYFYLDIAKNIKANNKYLIFDKRRSSPEGFNLPPFPPLPSILTLITSSFFNVSLILAGSFLPVILCFFVIFPLFLWGKITNNSYGFIIASSLIILSKSYIERTTFGDLDTDCLNLTFPLLISYFFYCYCHNKKIKSYIYLFFAYLSLFIFLWWWIHAYSIIIFYGLTIQIITVIAIYKTNKEIDYLSILLYIIFLITIMYTYSISFSQIYNQLSSFLSYILGISYNESVLFPNISTSNIEQSHLNLQYFIQLTSFNIYFFAISFFGIILFFKKHPKEFIFLSPLLFIGLLSFFAIRFTSFLLPIMSIGAGLAIITISKKLGKYFKSIFIITVIYFFSTHVYNILIDPPPSSSVFDSHTIKGMHRIKDLTPPGSIIFSWWDEGHPLVYWSERSTFADGYIHSSERLCHLAIPFATDNIRLSANYLSFLSHHGTNGVKKFSNLVNLPYTKSFILLRKLLEKSPDEALDSISLILQENNLPSDKLSNIMSFLYPNKEKDIYLFIDKNFISQGILSWINFYGTWDVLKKTGGLSLPHVNFSIEHDYEKLYSNTRGLQIDKNTGAMTYENLFIEPISLQSIRIYNTNLNQIPLIKDTLIYSTAQEQIHLNEFAFNNIFNPTVNSTKGEYFLDIFPVNNIAYLMDKNIANMVARKLFFHVYNPTHINDYFTLIDEDFLNYQLWRINPDKIKN